MVQAAICEGYPRPGDEVFHRARHQHLTGSCLARNAGTNVHADATDVPVNELYFARVHIGADLETEIPTVVASKQRASNCPRRTVEGGREAVARGNDLRPPESVPRGRHQRVMPTEDSAPFPFAEVRDEPG